MNILFQNIHQSSLNTAYKVFWIRCIGSFHHGGFCEVRARICRIRICEYSVLMYDQLVLGVDQSIIYSVSVDVDMVYSSKSGNVHQGDVKEVRVGRFQTNQDVDVDGDQAHQGRRSLLVDNTKYRGTAHLGLWNPKGTGKETIVYADSDHTGDYFDRKSTSGVCTFMGCCLTSWFSKKQTALAIFTADAEYDSTEKACQQALWMKQALIDYDIRLDDVPIM
ncbi:hypothetical protein Tco_0341187 [Tanacetum coccineum]